MLETILEMYSKGISGEIIANQLNKSPTYVYKQLRDNGVSIGKGGFKKGHTVSLHTKDKLKKALVGKPKSIEHKAKLSLAMSGSNNPNFGKKAKINGKRCFWKCHDGSVVSLRSRWEAAYAEYLDRNNIKWLYEHRTFILHNGRAYTPDFFLMDTNEWVEIKGWLREEHKEKMNSFKEQYPKEKLTLLMKPDLISLGLDLTKDYAGLERPKTKCHNCNVEFIRKDKDQQFCSKKCSNKFVSTHGKISIQKPHTEKRSYHGIQTGERNNGSTVTEETAIQIIAMRKKGFSLLEISRHTKASIGNIGNIIKGRSWKHLDYLRGDKS